MASASVSVRLDAAAMRRLMTSPEGGIYRDLQRRGNNVLNQARRNCPVDEGRLRGSLSLEMRTEAVGGMSAPVARVGSNLPYAVYVHEGTGVYAGRGYIYPKRARLLRWPIKNNSGVGSRRYRGGRTAQYAFARRVKGVPPRPFLRDALRMAR